MTERTSESRPASHAVRRRSSYRRRRCNYRGICLPPAAKQDSQEKGTTEELLKECESLKDDVLRRRAEMENLRRRVSREREEMNRRAGEELIASLLPGLDNLVRAMQAAETASDIEALLKGVQMVDEQFRSALSNHGLELVEALGQVFDPTIHEAVGIEHRDDVPENQIVTVLQDGFKLRGRLLRPAMVRVAKKKTE